jgi:cell division protein FtsW
MINKMEEQEAIRPSTNNFQFDKVILGAVIFLCLFSELVIFSSSGGLALKKDLNIYWLGLKQFGIILGTIAMIFFVANIQYQTFAKFSKLFFGFSLVLLVLLRMFGTEINGSVRWLKVPYLPSFQPTEVASIALIIFLAAIITTKQEVIKNFQKGFLPIVLPIVLLCGGVMLTKFATGAILFMTSFIFVFIGRLHTKYMLFIVGGFLLLFSCIILFKDYLPVGKTVSKRMKSYIMNVDTEEGLLSKDAKLTDVHYSKIAIVNGGLIGQGPGQSIFRNKLGYANDFVFAVICEEYGLFGGLFIFALYMIIFFRSVGIARKCSKPFPALLAIGMGLLITLQALIHIAVTLNVVPATGINMPLLSSGGTSMIFNGIAIGILLSVSKFSKIGNVAA